MPDAPPPAPMRSVSLTFLRYAGGFWVLLYHFGQSTFLADWGLRPLGPPMLAFFFTLSGFVMAVRYTDSRWPGTLRFWRARCARILPSYYFALALTILAFGVAVVPTTAFLLSALLMQSWAVTYAVTLNIPAWSLSVEWFFYLLFPLLAWGLRRWRPPLTWLWVGATALYLVTQVVLTALFNGPEADTLFLHNLIFYSPLSHLCCFVFGVVLGRTLTEWPSFTSRGTPAGWTAAWVAVMAGGLVLLWDQRLVDGSLGLPPLPAAASLWAPLFLVVIVVTVHPANAIGRLLASRPLEVLGDVSYPLYILQYPVVLLLGRWLLAPLGITPDNPWLFWFYLLVLTAGSYLLMITYEIPMRRWISGRRRTPRPAEAAAVAPVP